jgi:hypothetical protein
MGALGALKINSIGTAKKSEFEMPGGKTSLNAGSLKDLMKNSKPA